jgi:hypothetical protein
MPLRFKKAQAEEADKENAAAHAAQTKEDSYWASCRDGVKAAEKALAEAANSPGKMVDAKPDGKIKRGGVTLLKDLIKSRTAANPKATSNKVAEDAPEPKEGPLLVEARAAIAANAATRLPATPPRRTTTDAAADAATADATAATATATTARLVPQDGADCPSCGTRCLHFINESDLLIPDGGYRLDDGVFARCVACDARVPELDEV